MGKQNEPESCGPRVTPREFVEKAIRGLRVPPYKGIHVVYSGFNEAFRVYFSTDPRQAVEELRQQGLVQVRPAKGGVIIFLTNDVGNLSETGSDALKKILK